jgi:hypothetical protein
MPAKRKTNLSVVPFGMSNKHMKRKKPINSDLMRGMTPLTENQKELFRCYDNGSKHSSVWMLLVQERPLLPSTMLLKMC